MPAPPVSLTVTSGNPPPGVVSYDTAGFPEGVAVPVAVALTEQADDGVGLETLKQWFDAYQDTKTDEMEEQRTARRYYHGVQWTDEERRVLEDRKQPVIENNRIGPKIDGIVGVVIRLRQDPKASPRSQAHAAGADIGTAAVREVFDGSQWEALQSEVAQDLAIDGIGGAELDLEPGQDGTPEIVMRRVAPETFFYDPRSVKPDFSDGRYHGVYKWMDLDAAIELLPEKAEHLRESTDRTGGITTGLQDWDQLWYDTRLKRVKIAECWYRVRGEWRGAIYTGDLVLADVGSPFKNDAGKTISRYHMVSAGIDHNGNRYGFVRNMKSPQDEINHRRSKLLHIMNVNQVIYEDGAVDDIDDTLELLAKPDAAIKVHPGQRFEIRDQSPQMQGQAELLAEAKSSIENFGPTPALTGQGASSASGRAQAMQQQAGIAQLGPYFMRYKDWKLRLYRAVWSAIKVNWTNERFIRVAGEEEVKFLPVNQLVMTPEGPRIANALGQLDLDIVMDEGPDVVTLQEDVMQTINTMIQQGYKIPPSVPIKLSSLPPALKQELLAEMGPPQADPQAAQEQALAKQLQVAGATAEIRKKNADADRSQAEAVHKVAQARNSGALVAEHAAHTAQAMADIEHRQAQTRRVHSEADRHHIGNLAKLGSVLDGHLADAGMNAPAGPMPPPQAMPGPPPFGA